MNTIVTFLVEVLITLLASILITVYLKTPLKRILLVICGTEEGAQFWTVFSSIVLIGLSTIFALTYHPSSQSAEKVFFELMDRLSGNLAGYLATLIAAGMVIAFFSLITSIPRSEIKKM